MHTGRRNAHCCDSSRKQIFNLIAICGALGRWFVDRIEWGLANYDGRINQIFVQILSDGLDAEISRDGDKAMHQAMCMPVYMGPYH